jgi:hypothetical protein
MTNEKGASNGAMNPCEGAPLDSSPGLRPAQNDNGGGWQRLRDRRLPAGKTAQTRPKGRISFVGMSAKAKHE